MPRRRLDKPTDKRDAKTIGVRVNAAELTALEDRAKAARLTLPEYLRHMGLKGKITVRQTRQIPAAVMRELNKQGVNLNQLVKLANEGRFDPTLTPELRAVLRQITDALTTWGEEDEGGEG